MLYYTQVLTAGNELYWKIVLRDVTDTEYDLFMSALMRFCELGRLGGKRSNGMGEFEFLQMHWTDITKVGEKLEIEGSNTHGIYAKFLKENEAKVKEGLSKL